MIRKIDIKNGVRVVDYMGRVGNIVVKPKELTKMLRWANDKVLIRVFCDDKVERVYTESEVTLINFKGS